MNPSLEILACTRCPLAKLRDSHINPRWYSVPGELTTNPAGPLLAVMCEAPGEQETLSARPLVGKSGMLFDSLLEQVGLNRDEILLMNTIRCRPKGNNMKSREAIEAVVACDEWTVREFEHYNPKVVVVMGNTATQHVFGTAATIGIMRGTVRSTGEEHVYGKRLWLPTYHPAYLLPNRSPRSRPLVVQDLELAKELLNES